MESRARSVALRSRANDPTGGTKRRTGHKRAARTFLQNATIPAKARPDGPRFGMNRNKPAFWKARK
jgi:hypothetical protein